jgi:hypothetical protein
MAVPTEPRTQTHISGWISHGGGGGMVQHAKAVLGWINKAALKITPATIAASR